MDHAEENSCCYCAHGGRRAVLGPYPTLQLSFAVEPDSELEAEILGADVAVEDVVGDFMVLQPHGAVLVCAIGALAWGACCGAYLSVALPVAGAAGAVAPRAEAGWRRL